MRLFTAIDLPLDIVDSLRNVIERLSSAARINWSRPENLHITTKFIGEWPENRLEDLREALRAIPPSGSIPIAIQGLGFFPNQRSPRVFWAGIEAPRSLRDLASETDGALARLGIEPEKRAFSPHLTLARIKQPVPLDALQARIQEFESHNFGNFQSDRFYLYHSRLHPSGSVYTKISEFPLTR